MLNDAAQLVSTLLAPPLAPPRSIERARLSRRLDAAARHRLTCVRAPAGFGKTTLVAGWARDRLGRGGRVAWLTLAGPQDDARVFLRTLIAALRPACGSIGEATLTLLNSNLPVADAALATTLVNELGGLGDETFLVLDDFHLVTGAAPLAVLHELVVHAPAKLHFVLASRETPRFPLGRLRELGQYCEIRADELQFSPEEVGEFLRSEALDLSAAEAAALAANTEGWAAGLRLAAISMRDEPARAGFIDSFSGGHTAIAEFLQEDVLGRQPEALQAFLLDTAPLDELSPALCDYVRERDDSAALLRTAWQKGLFLFAVDAHGQRYRYHHLFAGFLRERGESADPSRARHLCARAGEWHSQHGAPIVAIDYALRAGEDARAGELLERYSEDVFTGGRVDMLLSLSRRLPARVLRHCPSLALDLVWIHTLNWAAPQAERLLQSVREYVRELEDRGAPTSRLKEKILHRELMVALLQDRIPEAEALWQAWQQISSGRDPYFEGSAQSPWQFATRERFDCLAVIRQAPRIRRLFLEAGAEFGTVWQDCIVAPAWLMSGDPEKAEEILRGAIDTARRVSGADSPVVAMPSLLLAEVLYERNELAGARGLLEQWLGRADRQGFVDQLIAGYVCASRLACIAGDRAGARALLDRGDELAAEHGFARLEAHLGEERVRQLQQLGALEEARRRTAARGLAGPVVPPGHQATVSDAVAALTLARLARGDADGHAAVPALKQWVKHVEGHFCVRWSLRLRAVLAQQLQALGETREAWRTLRPALQAAAASGLWRPLLDEGPGLLLLVESAAPLDAGTDDAIAGAAAEFRRLAALPAGDASLPATATPPRNLACPSGPLTGREREILRCVGNGSSNKEIAATLGVSEATVKWHLQHVFDKLGVHRRTGAVRRARELGLLA